MSDSKVRDDFITPLPWLVAAVSGNGAAGRPFPTLPDVSAKPKELPHAEPPLTQLPHAEEPPASLPRKKSGSGLKGGEGR